MKKILNNKNTLLVLAGIFLILSAVKIMKLLMYGFELDTQKSNAYNIGIITGEIVILGAFSITSYYYYRRYLNLKYFP
ncbi:hypothetical protein [Elizabethkingia meningoseptica]|uniref:hypothetical protein n=1 Tax=Elizabethkingia meningoseptica TaxID=238 RepID=UPI000841486B|nr:hypothetical protein [Elizabethkingia meningoseptica]MDE5489724.1 hypothetical protein [Elizabethkingia meningoseptica]MVW91409.1 hypothetical protein [Elizabethkingia meningoseptica]ODM55602.1 hypothetical protein BES09_03940 [Elizabethkingia meningoseptica]OHT30809.1 hypothetical protein BFF93_03945 [Elizabethkingia meningoseptica]OPC14924.1 hypothetical protein BAX93_02050 [Elizabethkingia meningoseptica]